MGGCRADSDSRLSMVQNLGRRKSGGVCRSLPGFESGDRNFKTLGSRREKEYLVRGKRKSRLNWGLGVCLALCLLLMFIPFPRRVPVMAGVLQVDGLEPVVCLEEGILKEIFLENETIQNGLFQNRPFQNGTVAPGQSLFLLENPELKQQMVELENGRLLLNSREQAIQRKRTQLVDSAESIALLAEQKKTERINSRDWCKESLT